MRFYTVRRNLFQSKAASDITSEIYWVGDARRISLFLDGSRQTVLGCNQDGRNEALNMNPQYWSVLTTLNPSRTLMDIEPGFRWLVVQRSGSSGTAVLELQQYA